jgi:hypothetical protein
MKSRIESPLYRMHLRFGEPRSYLNKVSKLSDEHPQSLIQAAPAGPNLDMDEMEGQDQTMQKCEIEGALK